MRRSLATATALLLLAGCDDPAETVREVVDARGNCSEDSLRVSSETCVRMFEKYAEMVTGGIHTYIGGMKAMDQAIQRLPPANFDTAGLGRAITLPRDSFAPHARPAREYLPPYDERYAEPGERYDEYAPDGYDRGPRTPVYDRPRAGERDAAAPPPPAPRRGVLLPPDARLNRPWLREEEPADGRERYPTRRPESYPGDYPEAYPEDLPEDYPQDLPGERRERRR